MLASERETTVVASDGEATVRVWSAQRRHISKMRKHGKFRELRSGDHDGTEWAEFEIAASDWSPVTGAKRTRKPMTEGQREAAAARLARARENRA